MHVERLLESEAEVTTFASWKEHLGPQPRMFSSRKRFSLGSDLWAGFSGLV